MTGASHLALNETSKADCKPNWIYFTINVSDLESSLVSLFSSVEWMKYIVRNVGISWALPDELEKFFFQATILLCLLSLRRLWVLLRLHCNLSTSIESVFLRRSCFCLHVLGCFTPNFYHVNRRFLENLYKSEFVIGEYPNLCTDPILHI